MLTKSAMLASMASKKNERRGCARSRRKRTGFERLKIVLEVAGIPEAELGELLRKKGINGSDLKAWREPTREALARVDKAAKHSAAAACRIQDLEHDLAKEDKRLKAVNASLALEQKSVRSGREAEEPTQPRSAP
jgi:hypothetical protein